MPFAFFSSCHISGNEPRAHLAERKAPALPRSSDISASLPWRDLSNFPMKSQLEEGASKHHKVWARQKRAFSSSSIVDPSPNKASLQGIVDSTGG